MTRAVEQGSRYPGVFIHQTALVAADAIGAGTRIWAFCNLLPGARVGRDCQLCDRVFIEGGATLGDRVTVKCGVSVWAGITLEHGVFVGPGAMFTNDPHPRSGRHLGEYPRTTVGRFASLGAGSILLPGIRVGVYALVGAGAVVTRDVPDHALVVGNPARRVGWVCVCGERLPAEEEATVRCDACGRRYRTGVDGPTMIEGNDNPDDRVTDGE